MATGYLHPLYADSLSEFGTPYELPRCKGWILKRQIPGISDHDAMGCYPLFACQDWSQLHADLENIGDELVCLSLVTDPCGDYDETYLRECFKDLVVPYKEHFMADLHYPLDSFVSRHHLRYARKALETVQVEQLSKPEEFIREWISLYSNLISRHGITGISLFSEAVFRKQMRVPGIVAFRAFIKKSTLGMTLWYHQGGVGYYHLGAYSNLGYASRASYALFRHALEYFAARGIRQLGLGAGAGVKATEKDGLSRFKKGWSNTTRTAYFCGRIFDRRRYGLILEDKRLLRHSDYFPAYRKGEFG